MKIIHRLLIAGLRTSARFLVSNLYITAIIYWAGYKH